MIDLSASELSSDSNEVWAALLAGEPCAADADPIAKAMYGLYGPIARPEKTPFVIGQMGQSLDGFIATTTGASHYINGPESLVHLHRLRALCDAVVVGWRTVEADDPQLTVRSAAGEDPLRVVIDIEGKLSVTHRAFGDSSTALRLTREGVASLENVSSETVPTIGTRADPKAVIDLLARRGCKRILIEGGGALVSNFLCDGLLDRLHLLVAPLILGDGRRGIVLPPATSLKTALRPASRQYHMGTDVLFDLDLRV